MDYSKKRIIKKSIPDNDSNGLRDTIEVTRDLTVKGVSVNVNIEHPYNGDLSVELHGPEGKKKTLLNPSRVPGKNVNKTFKGDDLNIFKGIKSKGEWTLKVIDAGARDSGSLMDWTLHLSLANSKKTEIFVTDSATLQSSQVCHQGGRIVDISADINVEHTHVGDLEVELIAPSGKSITLHNKVGGSQENLIKTYNSDQLKNFIGNTAKGKWTMKVSDHLKGDKGRLVRWGLKIKTSNAIQKDDLTKIEGIGPKINGLLNNAKIYSFRDLEKTDPSKIKDILNAAGPRYQMHDPGSWPRQSALAAAGKWNELKKLQDELDGGK